MCCSIKYAMPTFIKFLSGQAYTGGTGVMVGDKGIWDPHDPSKMGTPLGKWGPPLDGHFEALYEG